MNELPTGSSLRGIVKWLYDLSLYYYIVRIAGEPGKKEIRSIELLKKILVTFKVSLRPQSHSPGRKRKSGCSLHWPRFG